MNIIPYRFNVTILLLVLIAKVRFKPSSINHGNSRTDSLHSENIWAWSPVVFRQWVHTGHFGFLIFLTKIPCYGMYIQILSDRSLWRFNLNTVIFCIQHLKFGFILVSYPYHCPNKKSKSAKNSFFHKLRNTQPSRGNVTLTLSRDPLFITISDFK